MDTTQIILVTSIINIILDGIIVGIVVFVIQKKIDATLQKSLVEYQTKLISTHEKRVETLQNLYKKLALYADEFENLIMATSAAIALRREHPATVDDYRKAEAILDDFWMFFIENSLFLPDDIAAEIRSIYKQVKALHEIARSGLASGEIGVDSRGYLPMHWELSDYRDYTNYTQEEWDGFDYADIMDIFTTDMRHKVKELKDLYKSVAETK